jgi:hypothetical protein
MRRGKTAATSQKNDIETLKELRSSEILQSMAVARKKSLEEAESEVKDLFAAWQEQGTVEELS